MKTSDATISGSFLALQQAAQGVVTNAAAHMRPMVRTYRDLFYVAEIEEDTTLKAFSIAILVGFHITFAIWISSPFTSVTAVEASLHSCWPFFQNCESLIFLKALPYGYTQSLAFMVLFGVTLGAFWAMYVRRWTLVHFLILILFVAKLYFMLVNYRNRGNYDYYHNLFSLIFLFIGHKRYFAQLTLVFCYFLSVSTKIHASWILGQYFTALQPGLPLFPEGTEPVMTAIVMLMEMIGAWFLLSKHRLLQRSVLTFFIIFHLYSGILVEYRYPTIVLPVLIILFGPFFEAPSQIPFDMRSVRGWTLIALLLLGQMIPKMIPGDEKLTMEGNFYGLYMFEANHQCYGHIARNGEVVHRFSSSNASNRCDPYEYWYGAKQWFCGRFSGKTAFVFNHSINGEPFRQIVNEEDLCSLEYKPFGHNSWIKDEVEAKAVARPVKNFYGSPNMASIASKNAIGSR